VTAPPGHGPRHRPAGEPYAVLPGMWEARGDPPPETGGLPMSHWLSIRKGGLDPLPGGGAVRNICDRNAGPSAAGLDGLPMLHQRRLRRCHGASDGSLWSVPASGSTWCWTDSAAVARRADSNPPGQRFAPATPPGPRIDCACTGLI